MTTTPRAIIHIDGDSFFAACEQSRNPALRGKPVITGKERGIASSMSYEAKLMGVTRAMSYREIMAVCPNAVFIPSDYETYSLLSRRFYAIVRRIAGNEVDEYSIDECFADITGMDRVLGKTYEEICLQLQKTLMRELGFTFSIGLGPNKLIAKIGSKWKKPHGFTAIDGKNINKILKELPASKLWGIGRQTTAFLETKDVITAFELKSKPKVWIQHHLSKPFYELWRELHGELAWPLNTAEKVSYGSIQKVKTFTPPSQDRKFILSQLSQNIENACMKARQYQLATKEVHIYFRTQDFQDFSLKIVLPRYTSFPNEIIRACTEQISLIYSAKHQYRATGITLAKLQRDPFAQRDIFGEHLESDKLTRLYGGIDAVRAKYGKYTVFLGSSFQAKTVARHLGDRGDAPVRTTALFHGETFRKRINIPMFLGAMR